MRWCLGTSVCPYYQNPSSWELYLVSTGQGMKKERTKHSGEGKDVTEYPIQLWISECVRVCMSVGEYKIHLDALSSHILFFHLPATHPSSVAPGPAASVPLRNLLEIHVLWPHPRSVKSEPLGKGPRNRCCNKPSRWFWCLLPVDNQCLRSTLREVSNTKSLRCTRWTKSYGSPASASQSWSPDSLCYFPITTIKTTLLQGTVAHVCNPSYPGGCDRRSQVSGQTWRVSKTLSLKN